jgi:hypothetical protein
MLAELARAQWALLVAQVIVWTRPTGTLIGAPDAAGGERRPPNARAVRLARSVRRAADHGVFRPRCLVRSVAIQRLFEAHGIDGSIIRIGVRHREGRFEAHAWVELDGRVLGDDDNGVRSFTRLLDMHAS